MFPPQKSLGILKPLGGGDPIPLKKDELVLGRRPTCDIRLDFENISGRHCVLKMVQGVWHVRDLGSTNGTTLNGQVLAHEHGVMPDDELGIAGHYFAIDYEPIAPTSLVDANQVLEEEIAETRKESLLEMAGLEGERRGRFNRPSRAPDKVVRPSASEAGFTDVVPAEFRDEREVAASDDDFLKMIQDDIDEARPKRTGR